MRKYLVVFFFFSVMIDSSGQTIQVLDDFLNYKNGESSSGVNRSGSNDINNFSIKENAEGSRYLLTNWVRAKVFITDTTMINTEGYVFNYDKMLKKLIATKDGQTLIEVNTDHIKSFVLIGADETDSFERVPAISNEFFISLVKDDKKYSLYKSVKTKFQKANYYNNGIVESGNKYDSYTDVFEYYVVFADGKYKKVELKKKSVKNIFSGEATKVSQYFSNKDEEVGGLGTVNESFLIGLVNFLNQE